MSGAPRSPAPGPGGARPPAADAGATREDRARAAALMAPLDARPTAPAAADAVAAACDRALALDPGCALARPVFERLAMEATNVTLHHTSGALTAEAFLVALSAGCGGEQAVPLR